MTLQDKDQGNGVKHTRCSTFIKKKQLLVKGECDNPKFQKRNAMIVFFDPSTGEFKGKSEFLCVCLSVN